MHLKKIFAPFEYARKNHLSFAEFLGRRRYELAVAPDSESSDNSVFPRFLIRQQGNGIRAERERHSHPLDVVRGARIFRSQQSRQSGMYVCYYYYYYYPQRIPFSQTNFLSEKYSSADLVVIFRRGIFSLSDVNAVFSVSSLSVVFFDR